MKTVVLRDKIDQLLGTLCMLQSVNFEEICDHGVRGIHDTLATAITVAESVKEILEN